MEAFVFEQKMLFRVDFLSVTLDHYTGSMLQGGARVQTLGHLAFKVLYMYKLENR